MCCLSIRNRDCGRSRTAAAAAVVGDLQAAVAVVVGDL
jgi:hypothetical protein